MTGRLVVSLSGAWLCRVVKVFVLVRPVLASVRLGFAWVVSIAMVGFYFLRVDPLTFDTRGVVPVGYAAFAFVLGVTLGLFLRRTLPAMAVTFVGYVATRVALALLLRPRLAPIDQLSAAITTRNFLNLSNGITVNIDTPGAWITAEQTINAAGDAVAPPDAAINACLGSVPGQANQACFTRATAGLRQLVIYQPADHFWALQSAELVIYLALAVLLAGCCVWQIHRRMS